MLRLRENASGRLAGGFPSWSGYAFCFPSAEDAAEGPNSLPLANSNLTSKA